MRLRWTHVCFTAIASAATSALFAFGCSSNGASPPPDAGLSQCPTALGAANGAACQSPLLCPYEFPCGDFHEQVTCSCAAGTMVCITDATDASVAPGASPVCSPLGNPAACPSSEPENLSPCQTTGLQCAYHGLLCPGSASPNVDTCECQGGVNGGLVFDCLVSECTPSEAGVGTLPESGADGAGSGTDASDHDASQDAGDEGG